MIALTGAAAAATIGGYQTVASLSESPDNTSPDQNQSDHGSADTDDLGPEESYESREGDILTGITPGVLDRPGREALDTWLGMDHAVEVSFVDVGMTHRGITYYLEQTLDQIWERRRVPMVMFQPAIEEDGETSSEINRHIANGEHDELFESWADKFAAWIYAEEYPRRAYINLAPEFNGDWSPWSPAVGDTDETDFVEMWRRIHDIFSDTELDSEHIQWVWSMDTSTRGVDVSACYPGGDYVDWVGIHGYNWDGWGGWMSPAEHYDGVLETVRSITDRPIAFTEFSTSAQVEDGFDPERKAEWIYDVYAYFLEENVRMACWYNDEPDVDWAIFGGEHGVETVTVEGIEYRVYPAYREVVNESGMLGAHPSHPQILTTEEFQGEF
ncbi:glycoside hydrolase family 26 protein [Halorubrum sp. Hd13]|uniref:glycoside hydrolase family 26 protein n=1 Tax=Halorubrum sp. Hd13 TaxID=1480728 RepID=UPI001481EE15|nr:glycosyl hydrolase [Halorubrum sp. Hd13]